MKKTQIIVTIALLSFLQFIAQNHCGYDEHEVNILTQPLGQTDQNVSRTTFTGSNVEKIVLKVNFWNINNENGENPHPLNRYNALKEVAQLNKNFNEFNIFFKFSGISSFDDPTDALIADLYDIDVNTWSDFWNAGGPVNPLTYFVGENSYAFNGQINIYSVNTFTAINGIENYHDSWGTKMVDGYGRFFAIPMVHDRIGNDESSFFLTHLMGHVFNLKHTYTCYVGCENATRDDSGNDEDYNAHIAGDKIVDTFATPKNAGYDVNCNYKDTKIDPVGSLYDVEDYEPEIKNFMGESHFCEQRFTTGQVAEMRWYAQFIANLPDIDVFQLIPVSTLYEHYDTLTINNEVRYLYQPGFDYEFVDCFGNYPVPADYNDLSFQTYGNIMYSFDVNEDHYGDIQQQKHRAFRILQLDSQTVRKCYGVANIIGGSLVRFNDGVPNTNVTITPMDLQEANDSDYINNLNNGLYNIRKSRSDGTIEEQLILKDE